MPTLPDRLTRSPIRRASALLVVATVALACTGTVSNPVVKDPLQDDVRAFLQARSQPWQPPAAGSAEAQGSAEPLIEIGGLVERPGALVIGPYARTVRDAIEAMGPTKQPDAVVRIRPAVDAAPALFAEAQQHGSSFEIPIASIATLAPVYVRPGDAIEIVAAPVAEETVAPRAEANASVAPAEATPAAGATPEAGAAVEAPTPAGTAPSTVADAASPTSATAPIPAAAPTAAVPAVAAAPATPEGGADLRKEIEALRRDMEARLTAVREELARLRDENARLRGRLEPPARTAAAPVAAGSLPAGGRRPAGGSETDTARASAADTPSRAASERAPAVSGDADSVAEARPARSVRVTGSVTRPGSYPLSQVKTVRGAIRAAGGAADADLGAVEVRGESHGGALVGIGLGLGGTGRTLVDVAAVDAGTSEDLPLQGGEVIFVPPAAAAGAKP